MDRAITMQTLLDQPGVSLSHTQDGCPLLHLQHADFSASLALLGGQLLQFQTGKDPALLYLSPLAQLQAGRAIRGGVPICWPWFGPHPENPEAPQHGVARTSLWQLESLTQNQQGFQLSLSGPELQGVSVRLHYALGKQIRIDLTSTNHAASPQTISCALHSYLAISNAEHARITGLAGTRYLDKLTAQIRHHTDDSLSCKGELDRVVYDVQALELSDPGWHRRIRVETQGSNTLVLWNPGQTKARALKDLPDQAWRDFICIEAANAEQDARTLAPGDSHTLSTRLHAIPL